MYPLPDRSKKVPRAGKLSTPGRFLRSAKLARKITVGEQRCTVAKAEGTQRIALVHASVFFVNNNFTWRDIYAQEKSRRVIFQSLSSFRNC